MPVPAPRAHSVPGAHGPADRPWAAVAVVGPGAATDEECAAAQAVGRGLASAGLVVVTGGLGGVMAAACRGAREAGGHTVGLLPGTDPGAANPWVQLPLATGLGEGRNVLVVRAARAVVAVGGSWGTLAEVALACRIGRPVATLTSVGGWSAYDAHGVPPAGGPTVVADPDAAVAWARDAVAAAGDTAPPTME